ncbi:MAG: PKD domain-containing protein, partial [Deltaproteobacteria bacterium]|nr:PKD domain-containing protein [Deltaproteobacteria bacterium]
PAYNGHRTIFKAIARNADDTRPASCTVLKYRWNITGAIDAQGNDIWSDCYANAHGGAQNAATKWITVSATVNSKRDPYRLDCRASLPTVDPGQVKKKIFTAKIQVDCDGALAYGSYPIIVHAEVGQGIDLKTDPEVDPRGVVPDAVNDVVRAGPDDGEWELDVKRQVAIDDALWWLHGNTSRSGSGNALTTGWSVTDKWEAAGGAYLWAMAQNGHFPAYPPGTYDDGGEGIPRVMRDNDQRWRHDPYAEDAARYLNFVLSCIRQGNTDAAAESNVVDGVDRGETIPGTDDGKGFNLVYKNSYELGHVLGGLGACGMGGSVAQVGQNYVKGKRLEYVVQQMVDWLSKTQIRSNNNPALKQNPDGAWIYTTYSGNDGHQADASTSQWVLIGLESADRGMKELGVIVPDGVKYRTANFLHRNMKRLNNQYRGAGSYRNSYNDDNGHETHLAGGLLVGLGWLGVNHWVTDGPGWNEVPSGYSGYTRKQLKADTYDVILDYEARAFFCNETKTSHHSWNGCAFADRNARWGVKSDATAVSLGRGNVYTMYSIQKGARTIEPELTHFVSGDIRIDWYREYTYYFVNNQEDDGSIASKWTNTHADWYADDVGNTVAWGEVLVQTPTLFDPKPVAIGSATPLQVVEGCSGVQQPVSFRHELSYHQSPQRVMVEYQWIFGTADKGAGESWNAYFNRIFGATPQIVPDPTALDPLDEYVTAGGEVIGWHGRDRLRLPGKVWERAGVYTAALRIVDDKGITNVTTVEGITVVPQPAVEPAVSAGGPYFLRSGEELELEGSGWDDNESCGDGITFTWSIRPGEEWIPLFSDVDDPVQTVGWELFADLPRGVAIPLRLEATDGTGNTAKADTELTLFDIHPIACFSAEPATVGCQEPVTVNGSCSSHEDPRQRVIKWEWDFESDGTVDAIGEVLQHGYQLVGSYWIHLLASDELGITGETKRQVTVEPRRSPVASAGGPYKLATWLDEQGRRVGGALALNGSGSSDPDRDCGDRIVLYEWDVNGDGLFNDGVQSDQPRLGVTWATLLARLQGRPEAEWLAGPTGQPSVSIRLRVTDSSGRSHVDLTTLSIHHNAPYALFSANPQQASCLGSITFDASASYHGMPPHQINSYQWDFDVKEGEAFVPEAFGRVVIHEYDNFSIYEPVL